MLLGSNTSPLSLTGHNGYSGVVLPEPLQWLSMLPTHSRVPGPQGLSLRAHKSIHLLSCDLQALFPLLLLCIYIQSRHDINSHQLKMKTAINSLCRPGFLLTFRQASGHPCLFFPDTQSLPLHGMKLQSPCDPSSTERDQVRLKKLARVNLMKVNRAK